MKKLFLPLYFSLAMVSQTAGQAVTLPSGFGQSLLAEGLNPTSMAFAPDGRIFLAQKDGRVLLYHDGQLHSQPFISLAVDAYNEKGLNGIAIDPHFDTQPWVYLYYTVPGNQHNRVVRVWANGDFAVPGSEQVLIDLDPLSGSIHNAGALVFGADERLYIGVGDGAKSDNAQNLNTVLGKILRLNADGSIPADNPFYNQLSGKNRAIYAYGVRNPFSMSFDPATEKIFFCDVGAEAWEEVNELTPGANYGWKLYQGASGNPGFKDPVFAYNHDDGCAIVGAAFAFHNNALVPAAYRGKFFFADYCKGWIKMLDPATGAFAGTFATGIDRPVSLLPTPAGELFYLARAGLGGGSETDNTASQEGAVWKVFWVGEGKPLITTQPQPVLVAEGESAVFITQAFGSQPIHYQWYLNGVSIPGADSTLLVLQSLSLSDSGSTVFCVAENNFGTTAGQPALVGVSANHRPEPVIGSPSADLLYRGGDTLFFSGQATDPEEGQLAADRLTWRIDFHHAGHTHPALPPSSGIAQGQFAISKIGETATDVFFRIYLTARDAQGFDKTTWRDIYPRKIQINLAGPAGIAMNVDGQIRTLPAVFESVSGINRTIQAPETQRIGDQIYLFDHWSGGDTDPLISVPTPDTALSVEAFFQAYHLGNGSGLAAQYFIDPQGDLDDPPVLMRIDTTVNFNWGDGSPDPVLPSNLFTARWRGFVEPVYSEVYSFHVFSDDGVRLWVGDSLVIDHWEPQAPKENSGSIALESGKKYPIRLEFLEVGGGALVQMYWSSPHQIKEIVPKRQLYPPAIPFPAGIWGNLGMDANNNGFWEPGEPVFAGATVRLYDAVADTFMAATVSLANGRYSFSELPAGSYYLQILLPPTADLWLPVQNADANGRTPVIDLAEGEQWNLDAAWSAASIALAGTVWLDLNRNDLREPSEPLLDDVAVLLYRSDSVLASATTTGSDGQYAYSIVAPGSYFLVFLPQFYPVPIQPAYGLNAQGQSADFYLSPGQSQLLDVAFVPDSLLSGVGGDAQEEWPGLKIYPNPTRNMLWIEMPGGAAGMSWSLYNLVGQQIRDTERAEPLPDLETVGRLDVTNIPPGVYLLVFEKNGARVTRKFIKQ